LNAGKSNTEDLMKSATRYSERGWPGSGPGRGRRGFTLVEALVTFAIVIILAGLIFVAIGPAIRTARQSAQTQVLRSLKLGVDQFKQQFGFLPPLVNGEDPFVVLSANQRRLRLLGENPADPIGVLKFLRYELNPQAQRYSESSLPFYLMGNLGKDVGGVDGPGYNTPEQDGSFSLLGPRHEPLYDTQETATDGPGAARSIRDRWNTPIRFYRWQPARFARGTAQAGQVDLMNTYVPRAVGYWLSNPAVRSAGYAIVSLGADGRTDDRRPDAAGNPANLAPEKQKGDATIDDIVETGE